MLVQPRVKSLVGEARRVTPPCAHLNFQSTTKMPPPRQFGQEVDHNVRRGPNLTPTQREQIISKYQAGVSTAELVKEFGRSEHAIRCTVKRWTTHHTTQELPRSSRPPILSTRQKKLLYRAARKTCKIKYLELIRHAVVH
jgi:hypothetical protein